MSKQVMTGLNDFITDIRNAKDKDAENKIISEEMAKIRSKFATEKFIDGYQKKKSIWKLLYMHILGYTIDFGHIEASQLIYSNKFTQKYTGYIALSLLLTEKNIEMWSKIASNIITDLNSGIEVHTSMALLMIGGLAPEKLVDKTIEYVVNMAIHSQSNQSFFIRKKALLTLLRIYRKYPEKFDTENWPQHMLSTLQTRYAGLSFINSTVSLLLGLCSLSNPENYFNCQSIIIKFLQKLVINKDCTQDYLYYQTPCPWLQVKLLKVLQYWKFPENEVLIEEILNRIISKTQITKSINKNNTDHSILFEAINLIIHYGKNITHKLILCIIKLLQMFLATKDANLKYLGLETICKFISENGSQYFNQSLDTILKSLTDPDISIRRRALDTLYLIANQNNAEKIVDQLLSYLQTQPDLSIKDQLVLKIAILAQKFAQNQIWYVDVVVRLVATSGQFITDDIWYRIIQLISGFGSPNIQLQKYASKKMYETMMMPHVTQNMVKIGVFVLSEFSEFVERSPEKILEVVYKHYMNCQSKGRPMIINAISKLGAKYPTITSQVQMYLQYAIQDIDSDVQQRAIQFNCLLKQDKEIIKKIMGKLPPYPKQMLYSNTLIKKLLAKKGKKSLVENDAQKIVIKNSTVGANHLSNHPLYHLCKERICHSTNQVDDFQKLQLSNEMKKLLILKQSEFSCISWNQEFKQSVGEVIITLKVNGISDLIVTIVKSPGLNILVSPIKYGQYPKFVIKLIPTGQKIELPVMRLEYLNQKVQISLPVLLNKFIIPVELKQQFDKYYQQFSSENDNYYKMDYFQKCDDSSLSIRKLGSFLSKICNICCVPVPSASNLKGLKGSGKVLVKGSIYPILVQAQIFDEDKTVFRISLRGFKKMTVSGLYQLISQYI